MKNQSSAAQRTWNVIGALLSGAMIITGAGCSCCCPPVTQPGPQGLQGPQSARFVAPPSGGIFQPVQGPGTAGTVQQICGVNVKRYWDLVDENGYAFQSPAPEDIGVLGYLVDQNTGEIFSNTRFQLYFFVNGQIKGCLTNVMGDDNYVGTNVVAGLGYHFTAYFKNITNPAPPPANHKLQFRATWTQQ